MRAPLEPPTPALSRFAFRCPVYRHSGEMCGGNGSANYGPVFRRGGLDDWLLDCWTCRAAGTGPGDYLRALAAEVGASDGSVLLDNPLHYLSHLITSSGGRERKPEELPSGANLRLWEVQLRRSRAWDWLQKKRGLEPATIRRWRLGYDGVAVTIPIFDPDDALVNVKRRYFPKPWFQKSDGSEVWKRSLAGRGAQLYPDVPAKGPIILCAGETDALLGRQWGLPCVSTTCGASLPRELVSKMQPEGRRVYVLYDIGEEALASITATQLRAAGARALPVGLGLPRKGEDLTDFFVRYNRTGDELWALVRRERGKVRRGQA